MKEPILQIKESFIFSSVQSGEISDDDNSRSRQDTLGEEDLMDIGEENMNTVMINEQYKNSGTIKMEGASKFLTAYAQQNSTGLNKSVVLSLSGLNFVKGSIVRYFEAMNVCRNQSFDLFINLTQLAELYAFLAFHMFAKSQSYQRLFDETMFDIQEIKGDDLSKYQDLHELYLYQQKYRNLRNFVVRLKNFAEQEIGEKNENIIQGDNPAIAVLIKTIPEAAIFQLFERFEQDAQNHIYKTVISVESVFYIYDCLNYLKPQIKSLIQDIQFKNWVIKAKKNEVSSYADKILAQYDILTKTSFPNLFKQNGGLKSTIPLQIERHLVETFTDYICDNILDSISKIKKCNDLGRESLIMDINYLRGTIEGMIQKHIDSFDSVTEYLEAFFKSKDELLDFVKRSSEKKFSYQQIKSILAIAPSINTNIKNSEKKEFQQNVDIFYKDFFVTFMFQNKSSHSY